MTRKILLCVNINSLFYHDLPGATWIGGDQNWKDFYIDLIAHCASKKVEVIFALVTHKAEFDIQCQTAAKSFKSFFQNAQMQMFKEHDNMTFCLTQEYTSGSMVYHSLENKTLVSATAEFSQFMIVDKMEDEKGAKRDLADKYNIPRSQSISIQNTKPVLFNPDKDMNTILANYQKNIKKSITDIIEKIPPEIIEKIPPVTVKYPSLIRMPRVIPGKKPAKRNLCIKISPPGSSTLVQVKEKVDQELKLLINDTAKLCLNNDNQEICHQPNSITILNAYNTAKEEDSMSQTSIHSPEELSTSTSKIKLT
jgi:hypothetical protein